MVALKRTAGLTLGAVCCRALYSVLAVADVGHTNKAAMFLSLLFKAMQADVSLARVCAFVKRLLQVALHQQPNFACGCLMITSQLLQVLLGPTTHHTLHALGLITHMRLWRTE